MPLSIKSLSNNTDFRYPPIGAHQIRLLHYAKDSSPKAVRLQIQSFDRKAAPPYIALSYVWGEKTPLGRIKLNNANKTIQPNLHNALRSLQAGLPQYFWIDALCIDQANCNERNEQVRQMEQIYANATHVASWLGLCSERLRPLFDLEVPTTSMRTLSPEKRKCIEVAFEILAEMPYWNRIWVQQEILLNPNVILYAGECSQSLHALIDWQSDQGRNLTFDSMLFSDLSSAFDWSNWRKAPALRLLTWARKHQSSDPRDKMFALLSLTAEHERVALQRYFPDYKLNLAQVVTVTLTHIRCFSGQKRAVQQLDSVLQCFGETPESACADTVSSYFRNVDNKTVVVNGQNVIRVSSRERSALKRQLLFTRLEGKIGELSMLDVCDCIFSQELGPRNDQEVDVRSSKTWQRSETWVLDPPLSRELNRFWLASISQEMEDLRM